MAPTLEKQKKDQGDGSGATRKLRASNTNLIDLTRPQDEAPNTRKALGSVYGNSRLLCTSTTATIATTETIHVKTVSKSSLSTSPSLRTSSSSLSSLPNPKAKTCTKTRPPSFHTTSPSFRNSQASAAPKGQSSRHTSALSLSSTSKNASLQRDYEYPRTKKPRIPATNHKQTSILWHKVMVEKKKYLQPTNASTAKVKGDLGLPDRSKRGKQVLRSRAASRSDTASINTNKTPSSDITGDTKAKGNNVYLDNPKFRELVLVPRCISIDSDPLSRSAFQHFQTLCLREMSPPLARYQDIPGLENTTVWLEGDERFRANIVDQYKEMKEWGLCEAEFSQYALEHLLKCEVRNPDMPVTRAWNTKRLIQLVAKPERLWKPPPVLDSLSITKDYTFDVRPDCSYWIPIDIFSDRYRNLVKELVFVKYKKILCPYLSIEFKKDDSKEEKCENQVAAASSIALYNLFKLKERRLRKSKKKWTQKHLANIKHYGITFRGEIFTVWCISPNQPLEITDNPTETWTGCMMESVHKNDCDTLTGVQNLMEWINEIHRWGLTVHGDSCQRDIQHCIEADDLMRTSLGPIDSRLPAESDTDPETTS